MVGYAATCKIRSADPPIVGSRYVERTDWWKHITSVPSPRVVVMQDIDEQPGTGAFLGKVHVNILSSLGCVGAVTNGAARELPGIEASGFQVFAGRLAISRAYIHVVEYGGRVEVGGLTIHPGDLIHGDRHGIITIPHDMAIKLPAVAGKIMEKKQQVIDLSKKPGATFQELSQALRELLDFNADHHSGWSKTVETMNKQTSSRQFVCACGRGRPHRHLDRAAPFLWEGSSQERLPGGRNGWGDESSPEISSAANYAFL